MRNYLLILFLSFTAFIACESDTDTYTVGEDFLDVDTKVIVTDTISIETSTIQLDSVNTTNPTRLLIGALQDQDFGNLKSKTFFNLLTSTYDINNDATFDSIGIILYYDTYYYGDTTKTQTFKVHEIIENFESHNEDDDNFYNTSTLEYSDTTLGELTFTPYPNKKDSIYIPINQDFGSDLFEKLQDNDINNSDDLYQIFKGLTIAPDENSNAVLGFSQPSTVMRMYYTIKGEDDEDNDYYNDFTIQSYTQSFNQTTSDKSNTVLNSIESYTDILSTKNTGNLAYIQSGTSFNMRVEFPAIENLNELEQNSTAINATLKFYPTLESYDTSETGVDSLAVYVIDKKNRVVSQLSSLSGSSVYATLSSQNDEFDSENYYTVDLTYFVEQVLTSTYDLDYALLFQLPNNNNGVNKVNIYDADNSDKSMKLSVTYLLY
ncbi:DUF4270 domain-containing protein [Lutibacter sp. A80]|uniref:DUF4270 family protein n=1 Tax=Lutibacter sp. A80 TaxID=2918453 RepID=UPI001F066852|nr:DUF4270 family protein [Lutibacter sp. A80]UMB59881.1 DUF4270 domain-containing protein [Lutibacter sp. A80]